VLKSGGVTSCGCVQREKVTRHGRTGTVEHDAWQNMLYRCNTVTSASYENYGGRGITVCERWQTFENFFADMGERPSARHSIDRIDNDRGYEPGNCRWATVAQQGRNRRTCHTLEFNGRSRSIAEIAELAGVSEPMLRDRLRKGWDLSSALSIPWLSPGVCQGLRRTRSGG
jgi:hypothetical protein